MSLDKAIEVIFFCYGIYSLYRFLKELERMALDHEERLKRLEGRNRYETQS